MCDFLKFHANFEFFATEVDLQTAFLKFSYFCILASFIANLICDPIFENDFKIQVDWCIFESDSI